MLDKTKNKSTGNYGEDLASEFLENKGYKILERNLHLICGEIDILAEDRRTLVIIEVKSVRGSGFGQALDLVRFKKQDKLRQLALALIQQHPDRQIRVDAIGVDLSQEPPVIEHIVNAVEGI